jgi:hypothetical protein
MAFTDSAPGPGIVWDVDMVRSVVQSVSITDIVANEVIGSSNKGSWVLNVWSVEQTAFTIQKSAYVEGIENKLGVSVGVGGRR